MNKADSLHKRGLIMIPFAFLPQYKSGNNFKTKNENQKTEVYWKNCCVACISAADHIDYNDDVALVSNVEVPEPYASLLHNRNIKTLCVPFDMFNFGATYHWGLAFYKLCVLYHACHELDYECFSYLDSDVFVQNSYSHIWEECRHKILLYDINHGLQVPHYVHCLSEIQNLLGEKKYITHYGGEFFAASKNMAQTFSETCLAISQKMVEKNFATTHGDEFISSIAADYMHPDVKNAGAYVYRFWTGDFRLVSTNYEYNPVVVLHVPHEKQSGMIRCYHYYLRHKKMPSKKKIWSLLHLRRRRLITILKSTLRKLLNGTLRIF